MNIIKEIDCTILDAAMTANKDEAEGIITRMQELWDSGGSFIIDPNNIIASMSPSQRKSDSEAEIASAISRAEEALRTIAIYGALRRMSRETVKAICALEVSDTFAAIKIFGREFLVRQFVDMWNKQHPDEEIWLAPAFEK